MFSRIASVFAVLLVLVPAGARADAALEERAAAFIKQLADQAVASLTAQDVSRPERIERFRELFDDHFAVKGIGRWVLGRYWPKATPGQQEEYLHLFEDMVVASYVDRFADYAGEALQIRDTTTIDANHASVHTEIMRPTGGAPIRVDWRVGSTGDTTKIVDVVVEGSSMSTTMRSDFASIVRQNGGKVEGLLEELRKKTESLR